MIIKTFIETVLYAMIEIILICWSIVVYREVGGVLPLLCLAAALGMHAITMVTLYLQGRLDGIKKCIDIEEK